MSRDFFWGFKEGTGHHLYLRAWKHICSPKSKGGLGLRQFTDINQAFVAKLGWQLLTATDNIWVPLFRVKYLRGIPFRAMRACPLSASWIMKGIWHCRHILLDNVCFQVEYRSELSIFANPWVPSLIGFRPPRPPDWSHDISKVSDLMIRDSRTWDSPLVQHLFPPEIRDAILNINIPQL